VSLRYVYAPPVSDGDDLISLDQARAEFKRSKKTLHKWLKDGRLERYRSEGDPRTFVSRAALREIVKPRLSDG
jgi:hypothetical protein